MDCHWLRSVRTLRKLGVIPFLSLVLACNLVEITAEPGTVLFQDDFSHPSSGWDRYQDDTYLSNYEAGGYRIKVFKPETDVWSNPRLNFADVRIEVDATKSEGPEDNVFGVLCRYQDPKNFYFFLVSSDGFVGIGLNKAGRRRVLSDEGESLLPSSAVVKGEATNHLRADCIGYQLRLYVNGVAVAEARAEEWPSGDVGLIAGTYEEPGTDIMFDNFSVLQPEAGEG